MLKKLRKLKELKTYVLALKTSQMDEKTIVFNSFKLLELPVLHKVEQMRNLNNYI